jgi:hypothetical protein
MGTFAIGSMHKIIAILLFLIASHQVDAQIDTTILHPSSDTIQHQKDSLTILKDTLIFRFKSKIRFSRKF